MNRFESMLAEPLVTSLGWALVHFLWQGTFVALLLGSVLAMLRQRSASARYAVASASMFLMFLSPLATMAVIHLTAPEWEASRLAAAAAQSPWQPLIVDSEAVSPEQPAIATASPPDRRSTWSEPFASVLPWFTAVWLLGVAVLSCRLAGGWLHTQRLRTRGTRSIEEKWRHELRRLCSQLRVTRPVRLLESTLVKVPTAIGWVRPVILLPASALTGLTAAQLQAIIAHELAHIRRFDYLTNLLQSLIETLLFYHPAVWWVSRRVRVERENCCDDLAVAVCCDVQTYARALIEMEQLRAVGPQLALAANGGELMARIQRLVGVTPEHRSRLSGLAGIVVFGVLVSTAVGAQVLLPPSSAPPGTHVSVLDWQEAKSLRSTTQPVRGSIPGDEHASSGAPRAPETVTGAPAIVPELPGQSGDDSVSLIRNASANPDPNRPEVVTIASGQTLNPQSPAAEAINSLSGSDPVERAGAACSLGRLGAVEAIPALIGLLGDESPIQPINCWSSGNWSPALSVFRHASPGEQAAIALAAMGQPSVEALIAALDNSNPSVRRNAAWAIGEIRGGLGTDRSAAVEPLIGALNDADPWVRVAAAFSLGEMRPRRATEALVTALGDVNWRVREMAARALGEMKARTGTEGLSALLQDENPRVRHKAAWALSEMPDSPSPSPSPSATQR